MSKKRGLPEKVRMRHSSHFVEELTARNEEPVGKMVALASIEPDPKQPRTTMGDLSELTHSVQDKGILEPILVRPAADESKATFVIISGERRFRAAMAAGLDEVPVIEMAVGEDEALEIALVENLQRKDLTPFEEAEGYKALADRFGYTHERISSAVGKSRTVITESLALLRIPPKVREAAQALEIHTKSLLLEVLKADSEEEMIELLEDLGLAKEARHHGLRHLAFAHRADDLERDALLVLAERVKNNAHAAARNFLNQLIARYFLSSIEWLAVRGYARRKSLMHLTIAGDRQNNRCLGVSRRFRNG